VANAAAQEVQIFIDLFQNHRGGIRLTGRQMMMRFG
jgi:hypothetical protein